MARPSREQKREEQRLRRPNIGQRDVLTVPEHLKEKGYEYRIVNDDEFRVHSLQEVGWDVVENTPVGEANVGQATQLGSVAGKPVGGGKKAVVMRIRSDYYKEDQAAKEALIKKQVEQLTENEMGNGLDKSNLEMRATVSTNRVIQEN